MDNGEGDPKLRSYEKFNLGNGVILVESPTYNASYRPPNAVCQDGGYIRDRDGIIKALVVDLAGQDSVSAELKYDLMNIFWNEDYSRVLIGDSSGIENQAAAFASLIAERNSFGDSHVVIESVGNCVYWAFIKKEDGSIDAILLNRPMTELQVDIDKGKKNYNKFKKANRNQRGGTYCVYQGSTINGLRRAKTLYKYEYTFPPGVIIIGMTDGVMEEGLTHLEPEFDSICPLNVTHYSIDSKHSIFVQKVVKIENKELVELISALDVNRLAHEGNQRTEDDAYAVGIYLP